jgi:hypothetical protein
VGVQGELAEAVKTLDLGVDAAQSELELAEKCATAVLRLRLVVRPETQSKAQPVGRLKSNAAAQALQARLGGASTPKATAPPSSGASGSRVNRNAPPAPLPPNKYFLLPPLPIDTSRTSILKACRVMPS